MRWRLVAAPIVTVFALAGWRAEFRASAPVPALPFYSDSTLSPVWTPDTSALPRVRAFSLVDQSGRAVNESAFDGHATVVTFFYTNCKDLCPRLQSKLASVRAAYPGDSALRLISISVAPEHDTAPVLAAYAAANHIAAPQWSLLTGARDEIDRMARESFFTNSLIVKSAAAAHGETIWLLDSSRRIRGLYNGTLPLDTKRLMEDIATLSDTRGG